MQNNRLQIFFLTAMHTCRRGTDASNSGLVGRVATAIMGTEERIMSNDGVTDLDQSLKDLKIDCTLKTAPAIEATGRFKTSNRLPGWARGGGGLNIATGTAARGGTSSDGGGQETKKSLQEEGLLEVWRAWCGYFWSRYMVVVLESFKRRLNLPIKPR
jgi:hypothetical protein